MIVFVHVCYSDSFAKYVLSKVFAVDLNKVTLFVTCYGIPVFIRRKKTVLYAVHTNCRPQCSSNVNSGILYSILHVQGSK